MFSKQEKILLFVLACIQFCHILDFLIMMPLGPRLTRAYNLDPHQFALLVSAYTFSAGISGFLASFFVDKFDRKKSLLFFLSGFIIGTFTCGLSNHYETLLLFRALTGIFGGVLGSLVMSIVSDTIPFERRGTAIGVVMGAFSVASVFGVPFSLFLTNSFDWHSPFLFLGVLTVLLWVLGYKKIPNMNSHLKGPHQNESKFHAIQHILNSPQQLLSLAMMFFLIIGHFSIIPYLSQSFVSNAGLLESQLPLIYLTGGICSFFASPFVGRLSDKIGKKKVFSISVFISCLPILIITQLKTHPVWLLLLISCSFFIMMSGRIVPAMAIMTGTATPKYRGSFMSITSSVQQIASATASYLAGIIVTRNALGQLEHFEDVGYIAIIMSLLSIIISTQVKPIEHEKVN